MQPSLVLHILPETYSMYGDLTIRFGRLCKAKVSLDQVTAMASGEAYVWQQGPSMPGTPRDMITAWCVHIPHEKENPVEKGIENRKVVR